MEIYEVRQRIIVSYPAVVGEFRNASIEPGEAKIFRQDDGYFSLTGDGQPERLIMFTQCLENWLANKRIVRIN